MKLHIEDDVADWYQEEFDLTHSENIRFYVRYGGAGGHVPGFSLGVRLEEPNEVFASTTRKNITFFVAAKDAWYFDGNDLYVKLSNQTNEPTFMCK